MLLLFSRFCVPYSCVCIRPQVCARKKQHHRQHRWSTAEALIAPMMARLVGGSQRKVSCWVEMFAVGWWPGRNSNSISTQIQMRLCAVSSAPRHEEYHALCGYTRWRLRRHAFGMYFLDDSCRPLRARKCTTITMHKCALDVRGVGRTHAVLMLR